MHHNKLRKPKSKIGFRANKEVMLVLENIALDAIPLPDGSQPTTSDCAKAIIEQAARQLTGRVAWVKANAPSDEQIKLARKAGYELIPTGFSSDDMFVDFDLIEANYASVMCIHPFHVLQAVKRGMTILLFEKDQLFCWHGSGLIRRYKI